MDPASQCNDSTDNDGDGWIDLDDPGCGGDPTATEADGYAGSTECNDSTDNDGDGDTDAADADCSSGMDNNESAR